MHRARVLPQRVERPGQHLASQSMWTSSRSTLRTFRPTAMVTSTSSRMATRTAHGSFKTASGRRCLIEPSLAQLRGMQPTRAVLFASSRVTRVLVPSALLAICRTSSAFPSLLRWERRRWKQAVRSLEAGHGVYSCPALRFTRGRGSRNVSLRRSFTERPLRPMGGCSRLGWVARQRSCLSSWDRSGRFLSSACATPPRPVAARRLRWAGALRTLSILRWTGDAHLRREQDTAWVCEPLRTRTAGKSLRRPQSRSPLHRRARLRSAGGVSTGRSRMSDDGLSPISEGSP